MSLNARQTGNYLIPSTNVLAFGRAAPPARSPDIAPEDWDDLFGAVRQRLRDAVAQAPAPTTGSRPDEPLARVRASVLECVAALDQLHASLRHELARR